MKKFIISLMVVQIILLCIVSIYFIAHEQIFVGLINTVVNVCCFVVSLNNIKGK